MTTLPLSLYVLAVLSRLIHEASSMQWPCIYYLFFMMRNITEECSKQDDLKINIFFDALAKIHHFYDENSVY